MLCRPVRSGVGLGVSDERGGNCEGKTRGDRHERGERDDRVERVNNIYHFPCVER